LEVIGNPTNPQGGQVGISSAADLDQAMREAGFVILLQSTVEMHGEEWTGPLQRVGELDKAVYEKEALAQRISEGEGTDEDYDGLDVDRLVPYMHDMVTVVSFLTRKTLSLAQAEDGHPESHSATLIMTKVVNPLHLRLVNLAECAALIGIVGREESRKRFAEAAAADAAKAAEVPLARGFYL
jgi:hypothetical protein